MAISATPSTSWSTESEFTGSSEKRVTALPGRSARTSSRRSARRPALIGCRLPKGRKLALTFGAAADNYIKRLEEGAGKNIAIKRRQLRMYLKPFFGAMRLDAIAS